MTNIFIAGGSGGVGEALRELIAEMDGAELAGMADDTYGAIEGFLELAHRRVLPKVLILDIQLADGSGLGVLRFIKRIFPATKVIMLCDSALSGYREHCTRDGADYFFDKATEFPRLQQVMCELVAGFKRCDDAPGNVGVVA